MPNETTVERAQQDLREGKSPTTAAGEFVREELEHVRRGKHGARSPPQAIAIGLSKARRAGVPLEPPKPGAAKERTRRSARRAYEVGQGTRKPRAPARRRGRAVSLAPKRESRSAASRGALSRQAKNAASRRRARSPTGRSRARAGSGDLRMAGRWSRRVTETSNALDLEPGVFTYASPRAIALSLKRSAERSRRRKADPFRSAMSMLTFYINRAGRTLSPARRRVLERAKAELRRAFGKRG